MMDKTAEMKKIKDEVVNFTASPLYNFRMENDNHPVIGEGSHDANIMFIGEAPGKNEAETGKPFCGASGRILDELLVHVGIDRKSVYVTNILKDRPPANRDPLPEEIDLYANFLDRQIDIIEPKLIATLGRFSMQYIMNRYGLGDSISSISAIHGQVFKTELKHGKIKFIPLFHPAVAVYNSSRKDELKKDFTLLKKFI